MPTRAGEEAEYLPVLFLEPPNDMALGLDLYSEPERRASPDQARDTGRLVVSKRRTIIQDPPNVYTVLLHSPVYRRNAPTSTLEQRRAAFIGVNVELLRIHEIIHHALSKADLTDLDVELLDLSAVGEDRILWRSLGSREPARGHHWSKEFEFGGRRWALSFTGEPIDFASATLPWWPLLAALGGSVILAGIVSAHRMASRFEREVERAKTIGAYKLLGEIRGGGMGVVYRARHVLLRRPTAVKLLRGTHRESELRRFEREVRLTASLAHPNTIVVFDYGRTEDNLFYYAMEYIDGLNLESLVLQYGPLPPGRVIRIMRQACGALAEAHAVGLIHRDIKPSNIMVSDRGGIPDMVKVLDFGLAKELKTKDTTLSRAGTSYGTPAYLAPESITHPEEISQKVDIYGLGLVMHFLLTGVQPMRGETIAAVFYQVVTTPIERPSRLTEQPIPPRLEALIMMCLEKDPERRPASAVELEQLLLELDADDWTESDAREWWASWRERKIYDTSEPDQNELTVNLEARQAAAPQD
jgi:serine/threonine-protein kinase